MTHCVKGRITRGTHRNNFFRALAIQIRNETAPPPSLQCVLFLLILFFYQHFVNLILGRSTGYFPPLSTYSKQLTLGMIVINYKLIVEDF